MKARLLKKRLKNTGYNVSNNEGYIAVGSPMCHDLIKVDKATLRVTYALDTFHQGRSALLKKPDELLFIWDKLHELIETGEIQDIINGKDIIENPLPVFTVKNGQLVESVTDKYGWPNTDDNGYCMYENTHFPTKLQAFEYGINEYSAGESMAVRRQAELEAQLEKVKTEAKKYRGYVDGLIKSKGILQKVQKLSDEELPKYWSYQVGRIQKAEQENWLPELLQEAKEMKAAAENEMDARGIHWNIKKTT